MVNIQEQILTTIAVVYSYVWAQLLSLKFIFHIQFGLILGFIVFMGVTTVVNMLEHILITIEVGYSFFSAR